MVAKEEKEVARTKVSDSYTVEFDTPLKDYVTVEATTGGRGIVRNVGAIGESRRYMNLIEVSVEIASLLKDGFMVYFRSGEPVSWPDKIVKVSKL